MSKEKDIDALFEQFYADNFPKVKNFAWLLTKSERDAEDIAQSIFMKLWLRPELWRNRRSMSDYLYAATRNEIYALFRHQKVEREYEEKMMQSHLLDELCQGDTSMIENIYCKELLLLVKMSLNRMPERRRQVFELSRFDGLSNKEIANRLQLPLRTVEDHIYKTLAELRKVLMFVILFQIFP